ncbi:MAG: response regulator [Burkholderiales bacterium]
MARILAIEDDVTFLGLLRVHLSGAGHTVEIAEDAALGLRAIVSNPPDLVILDLNVPYLDSFELLEAVRADPMTRTLPVVVITGNTDDESYMRATKIGVSGYLTKPVAHGDLIKAVQEGLKARKPGR